MSTSSTYLANFLKQELHLVPKLFCHDNLRQRHVYLDSIIVEKENNYKRSYRSMHIDEAIKRGSVRWRASRPIWLWEEKMKMFTAVTLVVFLCCLEVALCYPSWPAAKPQGRPQGLPVGRPGSTGGNTLRRFGKTQGMLEKPRSHVSKTAIAQQGIWIIIVHVILWLQKGLLQHRWRHAANLSFYGWLQWQWICSLVWRRMLRFWTGFGCQSVFRGRGGMHLLY